MNLKKIILFILLVILCKIFYIYFFIDKSDTNILIGVFDNIYRSPVINSNISLNYNKIKSISDKYDIKLHIVISYIWLKIIELNPKINGYVSLFTNRIIYSNEISITFYDNKYNGFIDIIFTKEELSSLENYNKKFNEELENKRNNKSIQEHKITFSNRSTLQNTIAYISPTFIVTRLCQILHKHKSMYYSFLSYDNTEDTIIENIYSNTPYWIGQVNGIKILVTPVCNSKKINIGISVDHRIITGYELKNIIKDIDKIYKNL